MIVTEQSSSASPIFSNWWSQCSSFPNSPRVSLHDLTVAKVMIIVYMDSWYKMFKCICKRPEQQNNDEQNHIHILHSCWQHIVLFILSLPVKLLEAYPLLSILGYKQSFTCWVLSCNAKASESTHEAGLLKKIFSFKIVSI